MLLAGLAAASLGARTARAETPTRVESLEWLTADSDLIVIADYVSLPVYEERRDPDRYSVIIRARQFLKGAGLVTGTFSPREHALPGAPELELGLADVSERVSLRGQMEFNRPCLFFLVRAGRGSGAGQEAFGHPFELRSNSRPVVLTETVHHPSRQPDSPRFVPVRYALDFTPARGADAILSRVRKAAALPVPPGGMRRLDLNVPQRTALGSRFPGRGLRFTVPAEPWLAAVSAPRAEGSPPTDAAGGSLRDVRTEENVSTLRRFLKHPAGDPSGFGRARRVSYPLRRSAYIVLRAWGVPTPPPVIDDPIDSQRPLGVLAPAAAGVLLLTLACALLPRPPRRLGTADRFLPAALKRGALTALACAALLLATLALRGRTHADEVTFTARGARHWVSSCDGKLEWTTIRGWPLTSDEPRGPAFASFRLGSALDDRWRKGPQKAAGEQTRLGMTQVDGTTPDFGGVQRTYRRVGMWCPTLAIAAAALPVGFVLRAGAARLRRRSRARIGRCRACGYDLRGTAGRCPECGEWRGPIRRPVSGPRPEASPTTAVACAVVAVLAMTSTAKASPPQDDVFNNVTVTLEWEVADADLVVVGRVTEVSVAIHGVPDNRYRAVLAVQERLKGPETRGVIFRSTASRRRARTAAWRCRRWRPRLQRAPCRCCGCCHAAARRSGAERAAAAGGAPTAASTSEAATPAVLSAVKTRRPFIPRMPPCHGRLPHFACSRRPPLPHWLSSPPGAARPLSRPKIRTTP